MQCVPTKDLFFGDGHTKTSFNDKDMSSLFFFIKRPAKSAVLPLPPSRNFWLATPLVILQLNVKKSVIVEVAAVFHLLRIAKENRNSIPVKTFSFSESRLKKN